MDKGKIFKYLVGAGLFIGGMSYIYYNFIKGKFSFYLSFDNEKKSSNDFISMYLDKIKSQISLLYDKDKEVWIYNKKILCHINYLVNEIIYDIKFNQKENINYENDNDLKIFIYQNIINKYFEKDLSDVLPYITDKLILLPENKDFLPLYRHDESYISKILKENDEQKIEDSFFFASVKQIELDKLLNNIFNNDNKYNNKEIDKINEIINTDKFKDVLKFKQKFKKEFYERYQFDCRYLFDVYDYLYNEKKVSKKEDIQLLINKIIY